MANAYRIRLGFLPLDVIGTLAFNNFALSASTSQAEWVYQAWDAITITRIGVRLAAITGASPTYKASLQGVDGSGNPDGTIKGGASPASVSFNPSSLGWSANSWNWLTLDNPYTCSPGEVLSNVISYVSGTINASNNSSFTTDLSGGATLQSHLPYPIQNSSGTRTRRNNPGIFGYGSSGTAFGRPLLSTSQTNVGSGSTPDEWAVKFTLPSGWGSTFKIRAARFLCIPNTGANLAATLYDTDGTTVLQQVVVDGDLRVSASNLMQTFTFDESTLSTLNFGSAYRLSLAPQEATTHALNLATVASASDWDAWDMAQQFLYSSRTDAGAWTDDATKRMYGEIIISDWTASGGGASNYPRGIMTGGRL